MGQLLPRRHKHVDHPGERWDTKVWPEGQAMLGGETGRCEIHLAWITDFTSEADGRFQVHWTEEKEVWLRRPGFWGVFPFFKQRLLQPEYCFYVVSEADKALLAGELQKYEAALRNHDMRLVTCALHRQRHPHLGTSCYWIEE